MDGFNKSWIKQISQNHKEINTEIARWPKLENGVQMLIGIETTRIFNTLFVRLWIASVTTENYVESLKKLNIYLVCSLQCFYFIYTQ
jgi:hypothetical protein